MVKFLRTNGISHKIEELIINAKGQITFVSPFLKFPKTLYERILEKADEGVQIRFVYGKSELSKGQDILLRKIKNITVFYLDNLHAKCYINETAGIITSMNLYDFSEKTNREMGIYFDRLNNEELYNEVNVEIESIIKASTIKDFTGGNGVTPMRPTRNPLNTEKKSSFNSKLMKQLVKEFNSYSFTYRHINDQIVCSEFGQYFYLEINYTGPTLRVDFRLRGDFLLKKTLYNYIESHTEEVTKMIPTAFIHWGNQMKRIRLDFPMKHGKYDDLAMESLEEYVNWIKASNEAFPFLGRC